MQKVFIHSLLHFLTLSDFYFKELENLMNKSRVSLVPIRFGAGIKGKIAESWFHGLPVCKMKFNHFYLSL